MNSKKLLLGVAIAALASIAVSAEATTYVGVRTAGSASATLSITTDGATGVLTGSDITAWNILLHDGSTSFTLTEGNSQFLLVGSSLTATATALSFDFSAGGTNLALFQNPAVGSSIHFYCASTGFCGGNGSLPAESINPYDSFSPIYEGREGDLVIATAAGGVPEPATWALMIGGFGLAGASLRRRRAVVA